MKLRVLTLLAALALLAAACGGSDAGTTTTTTAETTTTTPATTTTAAETTTTAAVAEAPMIPADHEGRDQCFACHAEGVAGAPKVPEEPDHSQLTDDRAVCSACHQEAG